VNSSTSNSESNAYLAAYALACLVGVLLVGLVNWRVDPLQFYRRAAYAPVFSENQRYQNPGLARSYDYETVVIGTSHAENLLPGDIEARLGERAVKLAISGSSAREQAMVLTTALATGKVRHVIWALDKVAFAKPPGDVSSREGPFPHHLYTEGPRTVALYLLSTDTLRLSLEALAGVGHGELETLNAWHAQYEFGPLMVMEDWERRGRVLDRFNRQHVGPHPSRELIRQRSARVNLLGPIRRNPEVRFDLFFPPYSILAFMADLRTSERAFEERQRWKAFVVEATADWPNVRVFDFQGAAEINRDLQNYKDLEHYSLRINRWILDALSTGRFQVDPSTYESELARQSAQLQSYRREVCGGPAASRRLCPRVARPGST
jgi:hypothetical protein